MPFAELTNTDKGPRGIHTVDGLVMLEPGETRSLDIAEAELVDLPGYFAITTPSLSDMCAAIVKATDPDDPTAALDAMKIADLRALAAERGISLPETGTGEGGRVLKADIVAAIVAGPVEPQGDALDGMTDEELRATVQALTGEEAPADADRGALLALARGGTA